LLSNEALRVPEYLDEYDVIEDDRETPIPLSISFLNLRCDSGTANRVQKAAAQIINS
jgi:hypothetical protein